MNALSRFCFNEIKETKRRRGGGVYQEVKKMDGAEI